MLLLQHKPDPTPAYMTMLLLQHKPDPAPAYMIMLLLQHKPDPAPAYMTILHVIITTQARPSTSLHDHAACYYNTSPNFIGAVSSWSFSLPISVLPTLRQ